MQMVDIDVEKELKKKSKEALEKMRGGVKNKILELYQKHTELQENSVAAILEGKYRQMKVPQILLEVHSIECVGGTFQIHCYDILSDADMVKILRKIDI